MTASAAHTGATRVGGDNTLSQVRRASIGADTRGRSGGPCTGGDIIREAARTTNVVSSGPNCTVVPRQYLKGYANLRYQTFYKRILRADKGRERGSTKRMGTTASTSEGGATFRSGPTRWTLGSACDGSS